MTFRSISTLAFGAAVGLLPLATQAAEFSVVQNSQSTIAFAYKQMGVGMDGHFKKFKTQLAFDPAKPANARVSLDVDVTSIDTGFAEGDSEVAGKAWFDAKTYPKATFSASSVKAIGGNRYEVTGPLTIKGRTQTVTAPTNVTVQGNTAAFDGAFTIKRADFAIGEGQWADFGTVANEIQVKFHIVASTK